MSFNLRAATTRTGPPLSVTKSKSSSLKPNELNEQPPSLDPDPSPIDYNLPSPRRDFDSHVVSWKNSAADTQELELVTESQKNLTLGLDPSPTSSSTVNSLVHSATNFLQNDGHKFLLPQQQQQQSSSAWSATDPFLSSSVESPPPLIPAPLSTQARPPASSAKTPFVHDSFLFGIDYLSAQPPGPLHKYSAVGVQKSPKISLQRGLSPDGGGDWEDSVFGFRDSPGSATCSPSHGSNSGMRWSNYSATRGLGLRRTGRSLRTSQRGLSNCVAGDLRPQVWTDPSEDSSQEYEPNIFNIERGNGASFSLSSNQLSSSLPFNPPHEQVKVSFPLPSPTVSLPTTSVSRIHQTDMSSIPAALSPTAHGINGMIPPVAPPHILPPPRQAMSGILGPQVYNRSRGEDELGDEGSRFDHMPSALSRLAPPTTGSSSFQSSLSSNLLMPRLRDQRLSEPYSASSIGAAPGGLIGPSRFASSVSAATPSIKIMAGPSTRSIHSHMAEDTNGFMMYESEFLSSKKAASFSTSRLDSRSATGPQIVEVWANNLEDEFARIRDVVEQFQYIAMDTEFPGIVARPAGSCSDYHYKTIKINVDLLKVIQLGVTFADEKGRTPQGTSTWQFNFKFDLGKDLYAEDSIKFLKDSGIDFHKHQDIGIGIQEFGEVIMSSGLVMNKNVKWISFHGSYDFGYLLKLLTCSPLPEFEKEFFELLHDFFPSLYDIKFLLRKCRSLSCGSSLQRVAEHLDVHRIGRQHQAGSDSLVTCRTFFRLMETYFDNLLDDSIFSGVIYGLGDTSNLVVSNSTSVPETLSRSNTKNGVEADLGQAR